MTTPIRGRKSHQASLILTAAALLAAMLAYACGDGGTEPSPPPDPPRPTTVTVTPATAELTALGATVQLSAEVRDQNGQVMVGVAVTWSSSDASVAAVAASGLVTAAGNGTATITAMAGSVSGSATVTVAQEISAVKVTPAADTLLVTDTLRLSAEAADANGHAVAGAEFAWASSDTAVAVVDGSGLVTGVAAGEVAVTATSSGLTGSAELTVVAVPTTVAVTPDTVAFSALGQTVQLTAEVRDQAGRVMADVVVSWSSGDTTVVVVDSAGLVTAAGNGTATITAMAGSVSGSATVTVAQEISAVKVTPAADTLLVTDTLRLSAEAADANGHAVAGAEFAWASSDTAVAVVDGSGLVTGVAAGEVAVTATSSGLTGSAELTVVAVPTTVAVTPDTVAFSALGQTVQLTAEVRDQAGRVMADVVVSWSSGDTTVVVVDSAGLATANGGGATTITATAGEASGEAVVKVMQSVTVSPRADTIAPGDTLRLVAEAFGENGDRVEGAVFTWSTGDASVAAVDGTGLVRGVAEGRATISATAGGNQGTSEITVENPDRAALVALYESTDGPNWVNNDGWLTDTPLGDWYGVGTDASGRVSRLDLSGKWDETQRYINHGLSGPIPPELGNLANLTVLDLRENELTGPIPPELGNLANLTWLDLRENELTGPIPPELGNLANLTWLHLWANNLTGPIPPGLGKLANLTMLNLGKNSLVGPIPPELGNLANLTVLDLIENELTGPIPPELGKLANLTMLNLGKNSLVGPIPPELGNLANLTVLDLRENELTGPIPPELGNLANLTWLHLWVNNLTGPIPPGLGKLANLTRLNLGKNSLVGPIPPELGNLANLTVLDLIENELTGPIPPELGNLATVTSLDFRENELTGPIPPELGNLANLTVLHLWANSLSGAIPPELGNLANLTTLNLSRNAFSGPIPSSLLQLKQLERLHLGGNKTLCVPGILAFSSWVQGVENHDAADVSACNAADVAALRLLYETAGGTSWINSNGWLADFAVGDWHGVSADSLGRVTRLDLSGNGLAGRLPANLGAMNRMTVLRIDGNALSGRVPISLTQVPLREFRYVDTDLCTPTNESFRAWLNGIASHEGTGVECPPLSERDILQLLYETTGGPDWTHNQNWLTDAPLKDWYGIEVDGQGLVGISLHTNNLTGPIPSELGYLGNLERLRLSTNDLTGPIPSELGNLGNLERLRLSTNDLTGSIPSALGNLANLTELWLYENQLTGSIPSPLGNLANLTGLQLYENQLTGLIPSELSNLANLELLLLDSNDLTGQVPTEFGGMSSLRELSLAHNAGMGGALPTELTDLRRLDALLASGTELCAPSDPGFQVWLEGIRKRRIAPCVEGDPPEAYLIQAAQSRNFPVPLVAGEKALVRVFATARQTTSAGIPAVQARFYLNGRETHVEDIPGKSAPIPTEVDEGSLSKSANAEIPGHVVQPGLEMVIEIDPDGTLDPALGVMKRIPETGRLAVEVREMPILDLTLIPFVWSQTQDSSLVDLTRAIEMDPENHEMLWATRTLLPVGELKVTAHQPVLSSSNNAFTLVGQTEAIRAMEGGSGHYKGMMISPVTGALGVANLPGRSSFSVPHPEVLAHELGHNLSLPHPACQSGSFTDPSYPYANGTSGVWGYDFEEGGSLVAPSNRDLMGGCGSGRNWISDYNFTNALRFRLSDADSVGLPDRAPPTKSLLLWGGIGADSVPYLEPAFVVDAPPELPRSGGEYRLVGRTEGGTELFSLSFDMPEVADSGGSSSFAFVLPVRSRWEGNLATITLSGRGGSVTLDGDSDIPMAILRNPRTGQVRGILRDLPEVAMTQADAAVAISPTPGLEVLLSRGIPGREVWRR